MLKTDKLNDRQGFTLTEIIVVIIIIGLIAAFVAPNYRRTVEMEYERTARLNLEAIYKAQRIYLARTQTFWPTAPMAPAADVDQINDTLGLNITEENVSYTCNQVGGGNVKCWAQRAGGFRLATCVDADGLICCDAGPCPSIATACPY